MQIIIAGCLILILLIKVYETAERAGEKERKSLQERREEKKIERSRREEKRKGAEEKVRQDALMREVETYDGSRH